MRTRRTLLKELNDLRLANVALQDGLDEAMDKATLWYERACYAEGVAVERKLHIARQDAALDRARVELDKVVAELHAMKDFVSVLEQAAVGDEW